MRCKRASAYVAESGSVASAWQTCRKKWKVEKEKRTGEPPAIPTIHSIPLPFYCRVHGKCTQNCIVLGAFAHLDVHLPPVPQFPVHWIGSLPRVGFSVNDSVVSRPISIALFPPFLGKCRATFLSLWDSMPQPSLYILSMWQIAENGLLNVPPSLVDGRTNYRRFFIYKWVWRHEQTTKYFALLPLECAPAKWAARKMVYTSAEHNFIFLAVFPLNVGYS